MFLRIMRRRSDNYHELASLFQTISLCDYLSISENDSDLLICNNSSIPTGSSNLIWKAINLFRLKTGKKFALKITLDKHIPIEAGLGGGSSNAATALWAVNSLMGNLVNHDELQIWAGEIGSDVPFFLSMGTAYCTGRGEVVRPVPSLSKQKVWIIKPMEGLSTPAVYKQLNLENLEPRNPEIYLKDFEEGKACYFNDLESPAYELMPDLLKFKDSLLSMGFERVLLSGSGTAFVCFGDESKICVPKGQAYFQSPAHFINRSANNWYSV
ncbi:MAG: 4-(cytidine 5'-diphospho)-2-C-methyl-D-erythritol kinase [Parachlamydiaceae bacterium]|nr:4-(cytidine 5'-diphospho)-2-C-methyl-D-erythritol kinase [Parachlamydiaceae bacterium]